MNLEVLDPLSLGLADAGDDIFTCDYFVDLSGNLPSGSTDEWTSLENHFIADPQDPFTSIENLSSGTHTFIWTLSTPQCMEYDMDTVQVYVQSMPDAIDDSFALDIQSSSIEIDVLDNDQLADPEMVVFELLESLEETPITEIAEGVYQVDRQGPLGNTIVFNYQLCNEDCPDLCDTASVSIFMEEQSIEDLDIPNAITPNDDGVNETFMFPHLEFRADDYPDKELIIFNRWGNIIYQAQPYLNDWNGVDQSGQAIPQGTYYYVLRLDIAKGIILKGDVSILK